MNRVCLVLLDMNQQDTGTLFGSHNRIIISVMLAK
jgi:hypothetical protein